MTTLATLTVRLVGDAAELKSSLDDAERSVSGFGRTAGALGGMLKGALVVGAGAAVVGVGALGAVLGSSVSEAMAAEEVMAQLNSVLASTQGVAGVTADQATSLADSLSQVTRFEDDAIISGESMLLTFTNIGQDVFPYATQVMLDMSTALGQDLSTSAMQLGKALNSPVEGVAALRRVGVQLSDEQETLVKSLMATGDTARAQAVILAELQKEFGGSAVAAGQTMAGQMDILRNSLGNVKEQIGGALLPVLTQMLQAIGPQFITAAQNFATWFIAQGLPALQSFGNFISTQVYPALDRFGKWFEVTILPHLQAFGNFILTVVVPALQTFFTWVRTQVIPALQDLGEWLGPRLGRVFESLGRLFDGVSLIFQGVVSVIQTVIDKVREAIDWLMNAIATAREFLGLNGSFSSGGGGYGATPSTPAGGGGYGSTPSTPAGGGGYGSTPTRGQALAPVFQITINAPGGDPMTVAQAAQTGVLRAARAMGLA